MSKSGPKSGPQYTELNDMLFLLYQPDGESTLDLVFFHGISSVDYENMYKTAWMTRSGNECWPAKWIPKEKDFTKARIFSVRYDSSFTKTGNQGMFREEVLEEGLTHNLINFGDIGQKNPVILVGHDVGGLVLKRLCLYIQDKRDLHSIGPRCKAFLGNVKGVFYFGTPHQGFLCLDDGIPNKGDLVATWEQLHPHTAVSNNEFRMLRDEKRWKAWIVLPANKSSKDYIQAGEASMRYDCDSSLPVSETIEEINKPVDQRSSTYQYFVTALKDYVGKSPETSTGPHKKWSDAFDFTTLDYSGADYSKTNFVGQYRSG